MQLNLIAATLFILTTLSLKAEKLDTLGAPIINEFAQTICRGDIFEGYNFVGTYRDTFTTGTCDSIRILHLRFFAPTPTTRELICIEVDDPNPPPFGTSTEARIDSNGCAFNLITTTAPVPSDVTRFISLCEGESFTFEGVTLDRDTTVAFEKRTDLGCIYFDIWNVTIFPNVGDFNFDISICEGDSLLWNGAFVSQPGLYASGCGNSFLLLSFRPAVECQTTSTALPESQPIRLYPNPSSDFITVDGLGSSQESHRVQLINIQGQVVASYTTKLSLLRMDLSSLANGIYITKISSEKTNDIKTLSFLKI